MSKFFIALFLVCQAFIVASQDSLVRYSDLKFSSAFERENISKFIKNQSPDYFNLFLAVDPSVTPGAASDYRDKFDRLVSRLENEKYLKKSNDKKIKKLYEDVHEALLSKYEMQNRFSSVFVSGYYNCVSSTAIYGLVFNELNIPFDVKEKPTHVYLMSYPQADRIIVETTDPSGNFLKYNDRYKSAVVERLREGKLISEQEYSAKSVNELFNEFYFSDQNIGLKELVGIQYLNDALYKLDDKDYASGYEQLEKAYFFYPKENLGVMLIVINAQILEDLAYKDIKSMEYLAKLSRLKGLGLTEENIFAEFERMTQVKLTEEADSSGYRKYYEAFISQSDNASLNDEISYIYNLRRGLALFNTGNYNWSLPFLERAYELKPKNLDITRIYISAIGQKLNYESDNRKIIEQLEREASAHPALKDNNIFRSMLANAYVIAFGQAFDLNREKEGLHYKSLFEQYYKNDLNVQASNIGRAYSMAAVFYFRKGYSTKAKNLIKQGLGYAPGNYELLTRQRMIH